VTNAKSGRSATTTRGEGVFAKAYGEGNGSGIRTTLLDKKRIREIGEMILSEMQGYPLTNTTMVAAKKCFKEIVLNETGIEIIPEFVGTNFHETKGGIWDGIEVHLEYIVTKAKPYDADRERFEIQSGEYDGKAITVDENSRIHPYEKKIIIT
jgi:hypothetical protein